MFYSLHCSLLAECYPPKHTHTHKTCTPECQPSTGLGHYVRNASYDLGARIWKFQEAKSQVTQEWEEVLRVVWTKTQTYETALPMYFIH